MFNNAAFFGGLLALRFSDNQSRVGVFPLPLIFSLMDSHISSSGHIYQQPDSLEAAQAAQVDAEAVDSGSSSELGRVAQDIGSVIGKWNDKVNQALNQWLSDAQDMENALNNFTDTAKSVVQQLRGIIKAYQKYPGHLAFTQSQNQRMLDMMSALGMPPGQIQGGTVNSEGYNYYTGTQYAADIRIAIQYSVQDFQAFTATMSGYKQSETKDMFNVMFCYNAEKMNEESLTSAL